MFVNPVVMTRKSDGSVKMAMDLVEQNKQILRKPAQIPVSG